MKPHSAAPQGATRKLNMSAGVQRRSHMTYPGSYPSPK